MSNQHEELIEIGIGDDIEANLASWEPAWKPTWKPATQARLRTKRGLYVTTSLVWRIMSPFWPKSAPGPEKLRKTAYLDGLRGFAALLVYIHHHQLWAHEGTHQNHLFENGFGYDGHYHFAALPGVRLFFTGGHYAVSTFFVISGYVLSTKPLSLIQEREHVKLGDNLASALFRRWLRLFIPLIVTTFVYMSSWHALDLWVCGAEPKGKWLDEVWWWYLELKNFSFVFKEGGLPWFTYNFHLWSIPIEFRGSIVIYTCLLAFSRISKNARLWCQCALIFYFMYITDAWYCALFISGMLMCDLDLLAAKQQLPLALTKLEPYKKFIYYHLLVIGFYLGGVPSLNQDVDHLSRQRGWYYLSLLKPQAVFDYKWFYLFFAANFLVAAIPRVRCLKGFFETRFCQYLGRISFALYLVHGPVLWTIGDRLYTSTGWHQETQLINLHHWANKMELPKAGPLGMELSFLVPHFVLFPLTIWVAEIVTRLVDEPSVKFAQWLYQRMLPAAPAKEARSVKE
ncbi:acyltransferase family-domain-containing protein [Pseudomassariella vexata]|uniref:Acyltransferase family-domain-containing protein n=1 Tax=Pseudomassariella vexata TaxID=1141098 RepID=A0A1Y2EH40_9PEZI|nr:acyltransferase family-domain-containing protein [Pseudomassariella vexata]ORY70891.1 acyltransferase family-domain-containing protein [Pseudomassariella vexata]